MSTDAAYSTRIGHAGDLRRKTGGAAVAIAAIERHATVVVAGIIAAGPFFWATLIAAYVAVELGIIS